MNNLKNELLNNSNNDEARLQLCFEQLEHIEDFINEKVKQPTYIFKNSSKSREIKNKTNKTKSYTGIDLLLIILDIDQFNKDALSMLCQVMIENELRYVQVPSKSSTNDMERIKDIAFRNYLVNKDDSSLAYIQYLLANKPSFLGVELEDRIFKDDDKDDHICIAIEGLNKYPDEASKFYYQLSKYLPDNFSEIKLPTINSNNNGLNRIQLLIKSIENYKQQEEDQEENDLSTYYLNLIDLLSKNEVVEINNQSFTKLQLLVKSLEFNSDSTKYYSLILSIFEEMSTPNETVTIDNENYSREDLLLKLILQNDLPDDNDYQYFKEISYLYLSRYYESNKDIQNQQHYYNLYLNAKEINKSKLIQDFNNIEDPRKYLELQILLDKDEKVLIGRELMGKKECLLKAIEFELFDCHTNIYLELSKLVSGEINDTIKINNQTRLNKKELIELEYNMDPLNIDAQYQYLIENDGILDLISIGEDESLDYIKLIILISMISNNPKMPILYLYLIKILSSNGWESVKHILPVNKLNKRNVENKKYPEYFDYSIKQLAIKYLEYCEPIYPTISLDNYMGWYYLATKMSFSEIEFGKTKKEILQNIVQVNPNFSGAYYEFSIHLDKDSAPIEINNKFYSKLDLLLKAIDLEKEFSTIKVASFLGLTEYLTNQNNDKIQLLNGTKLNKQQIILEVLEEHPDCIYEGFLALELIHTMEENDIESIQINNELFTKDIISRMVLDHKINVQKSKIKNKINNLFKIFNSDI